MSPNFKIASDAPVLGTDNPEVVSENPVSNYLHIWYWTCPSHFQLSFQVPRVVTDCFTKHQQVGRYSYYGPQYQIVKQCANKIVYDIKTEVRTRNVYKTQTTPPGGFPPCEGPITPESAKKYGIDSWQCHDNCYSRKDGKGSK